MCRVRATFLFLMLGMLLLSVKEVSAQAAGLQADWVLYNGKILTANSEDPANFAIVEAVAIYDGKFVAVGGRVDDDRLELLAEEAALLVLLIDEHEHGVLQCRFTDSHRAR